MHLQLGVLWYVRALFTVPVNFNPKIVFIATTLHLQHNIQELNRLLFNVRRSERSGR